MSEATKSSTAADMGRHSHPGLISRRKMRVRIMNKLMVVCVPQNIQRISGGFGLRLVAWLSWVWERRRGDFSVRVMEGFVHKGDVVVDIGASWGSYAWRMSQIVGNNGHVYAFEPHPVRAGSLKAIRGGNSNLTIYPIALSDHAGEAQLYTPILEGRRVNALARLSVPCEGPTAAYDVASVQVERLDALLPADGAPVVFIKCDVEGHELAVLRGAEATLRRSLPTLLIEIEQRHQEADISATFDYLTGLGYAGYSLHAKGPRPLAEFDVRRDQLAFLDSDFRLMMPQGYVNDFLFVRPDTDIAHLCSIVEPPLKRGGHVRPPASPA